MRIYKALTDFDVHKWMYDSESLIYYVKAAGFQNVSRMGFQQSRITDVAELEPPGRVLHGAGICVESVKSLAAAEPELEILGTIADFPKRPSKSQI